MRLELGQGELLDNNFFVTISAQGITEAFAREMGQTLLVLVRELETFKGGLDLRRMHRIIVTTDMTTQLKELASLTASGAPITHTDEDYGVAVAKVLLLPKEEGIEILPVLHAEFVSPLTQSAKQVEIDNEDVHFALHLLHHELCHVHDDNKKLDALAPFILKHSYRGKDQYIRPTTDICWSEYIANRLSSSTASKKNINNMMQSFIDAIERTKPAIDEEISKYRTHEDTTHLLDLFQRHGVFLLTTAAYCLGYLDGLGVALGELDKKAEEALAGSYFEPTWQGMQKTLQEMHNTYPNGWTDLRVYDSLAEVIESYYATMGLILSTTDDGGCWLSVPFRQEKS